MTNRQHSLRNIAVKLNVSGTAEVLDEQRLYKDSYGFIKLQVYAPDTQNTDAPVCTAYCTTIDALGREKVSTRNHKLWYVGDFELDGANYLLFERYLPKEFTQTVGELKITFNYYDSAPTTDSNGKPVLDANGVPTRHATDLLVSSRYTTTVHAGGWNDDSVPLDINSAEAAQIGENMRNIAELQSDVQGLNNYIVDAMGEIATEKARAEAAEKELSDRIDEANRQVESVRNLGDYAGTFDTYADLPANASDFAQGITTRDFVSVRADETHKGLATRYIVKAISDSGAITWEYDITYQTDITGKLDKRPAAKAGDFIAFDENGNSADSGYKGADIDRAQQTADEAKAIALARDNSRVFDTAEDMWEWLSNPVNATTLTAGASLFIIDADAPDYWWTGTSAEEYHDKTDLSIFYNKDEIDEMRERTRQEIIDTYELTKTVKSPDDSAQKIVTLYKAEYDALAYKDPTTLYIVPDDTDPDEQTLQDQIDGLKERVARLEQIVGGLIK